MNVFQVLVLIAVVIEAIAAFGVAAGRVALVPLGLAFFMLAFLVRGL